jgi:hypothetical protein
MSIPTETEAVELTDPQRRHLEVLLERLIRETKDRLRTPRLSAITDGDGAVLRDALEALLREAQDTADRLGLHLAPRDADVRRQMAAWSSSWWSTVLDARPSALRAYGDVDEKTARVLAPLVDRLAGRLHRLTKLAEDASGEADRAGPGNQRGR